VEKIGDRLNNLLEVYTSKIGMVLGFELKASYLSHASRSFILFVYF
jgi:hypothetical protein